VRIETAIVLLFAVATAVAVIARALKIPYTVALVLAGVSMGAVEGLHAPRLTKELLYAVFLPGLIFEAAFHIGIENLRRNGRAIAYLAFPGVLVATALIAALLFAVVPGARGAWWTALAFASLITATDPIAVVGLFKTLAVPRRLGVIIEGESLVNDGTAAVVYALAVGFAATMHMDWVGAAIAFVKLVGLGVVIGGAFGFVISKIIGRINDPVVEITLTVIAAYGSFAAAEQLHVSGIVASLASGVLCGSYGAPRGMSHSTRVAVESFWEYVAFALNSTVFLLIGLRVKVSDLFHDWTTIAAAFLIVTLARGVVVFLAALLLRRSSERLPWSWALVLTWGGLRGALSMVLALALPMGFPGRQFVVTTTFGVVILSILICGLTMEPLLRRLGIARDGKPVT
jgi:CPA1 family monovalent cation:H+ antiporter